MMNAASITCFVFNDAELQSPELIRKVRALAAKTIPEPRNGVDFVADCLRDLPEVQFVNSIGQYVDIDLSIFEPTDNQIDLGDAERISARMADWFEYICSPVPDHVTPYVLPHTKERFRVLATILIALHPIEVSEWRRFIPSNDNFVARCCESRALCERCRFA
ncbi:MAG: hypothetical protein AAFN91_00890 [Pseudomonadota bacterium]